MLTVQFVDHSAEIKELISRKLLAAVGAAARNLADEYVTGLQVSLAPPHSGKGEIPHAYLGHRPGGYGPVNAPNTPNNTPLQGFASVQTKYLSDYIESGASGLFGSIEGFVGFAPGHVNSRQDNYLLEHDRKGRPWVMPLYRIAKEPMKDAASSAFKEAQ